jgi:hypothetical protein
MKMQLFSDSEIIRRYALAQLTRFPEGIRAVHLKQLVEEILGEYIPADDYSNGRYRSALWNLPEKFPEYVEKEALGRRNVILKPTQLLMQTEIELPEITKNEIVPDFVLEDLEEYLNTTQFQQALKAIDGILKVYNVENVEKIQQYVDALDLSDPDYLLGVALREINKTIQFLKNKKLI